MERHHASYPALARERLKINRKLMRAHSYSVIFGLQSETTAAAQT